MKRMFLFLAISLVFSFQNIKAQEYPIGISLSLFGYIETSQEQLMEIKNAGVEYVEVVMNQIMRYHPENEWYERAWTLKNRIDKAGLKVWSVHLPHTEKIDISFTNHEMRAYSLEKDEEAIRIASIFQPKRLILHPSNDPVLDNERSERLQYAKNGIGRLSLAAKAIGAVLCVEVLPRTNIGNNSAEIMQLIRDYPDVRCCFDTNHLLNEDHAHFMSVVGNRIGTVHFSDYDKVDEKHWIEGVGIIDWPELYKNLKATGYEGVAMHEVRSGENVNPFSIKSAYDHIVLQKTGNEDARHLIAMGNNMLYIFDADKAKQDGNFRNSIIWSWDAKSAAKETGINPDRLDFIDECKVKEGGENLLITGAHGWCIYLRKADGKVLFWTDNTDQAHSAEILPNNRVVVACSVPKNQLHLYDIEKPDKIIQTLDMKHAHGVYYCAKRNRLYAVGENCLRIFRLENWTGKKPRLVIERTVGTGWYVSDIHDLIPLDDDTLILTGNNAAFFNMKTGKLRHWDRFSGISSIKSMNYNKDTKEIIYTYSNQDDCQGAYPWSTWKVRNSYDLNDVGESVFYTPDINGYKIRVYNW